MIARISLCPLRVLLPALLLPVVASVSAQAPASVALEALTWTEVQQQIGAGKTTIIIPIGGTEQNGPAMALGKHNVRVKALAEKVALALGDALVAPVLAYVPEGSVDPPTGHMRFAGTISVPERTFESVLEWAARSFKRHGFRDIVALGDSGDYQHNLGAVAQRLNREWRASAVRVHAVPEYYRTIRADYVPLLEQRGFGTTEIGSHAGLADTSLMLAVDPRLVRVDRLAAMAPARAQGVDGDPRRASAELGQAGVELIVAKTVAAIRTATTRR